MKSVYERVSRTRETTNQMTNQVLTCAQLIIQSTSTVTNKLYELSMAALGRLAFALDDMIYSQLNLVHVAMFMQSATG